MFFLYLVLFCIAYYILVVPNKSPKPYAGVYTRPGKILKLYICTIILCLFKIPIDGVNVRCNHDNF